MMLFDSTSTGSEHNPGLANSQQPQKARAYQTVSWYFNTSSKRSRWRGRNCQYADEDYQSSLLSNGNLSIDRIHNFYHPF